MRFSILSVFLCLLLAFSKTNYGRVIENTEDKKVEDVLSRITQQLKRIQVEEIPSYFKGLVHEKPEKDEKVVTKDLDDDMIFDSPNSDEQDVAKRTAIFKHAVFWPANEKGVIHIPYQIKEDEFSPEEVFRLELAIESFNQALNCGDKPWIVQTNETEYIQFRRGSGCESYVGKMTQEPTLGGVQPIYVSTECILKPGKVIHEMMHALGYIHEHMRFDRDDYIHINYDNIRSGYERQFEKVGKEYLLTSEKYDYLSIMQYKKDAFARSEGLVTIETLDPDFQDKIGQRTTLSKLDLEGLNDYFKCPAVALPEPPKPPPTEPTKPKSYLGGCDFETESCKNVKIKSKYWKKFSDTRCGSYLADCKPLADKGLCTRQSIGSLMKAYCGTACKSCHQGTSLMLESNATHSGLFYITVRRREELLPVTECRDSRKATTPICLSFDFIRRSPSDVTLYDSIVRTYVMNYYDTSRGGIYPVYWSPRDMVKFNEGNEQWITYKETFFVRCLNTKVIIRGNKRADEFEIDNVMVTGGKCN